MARKRGGLSDPSGTRFSILADALAQRGLAISPASVPQPQRDSEVSVPAGELALTRCGKVTLRREKKGRGGKTVTIISGLGLQSDRLEQLARTLRKALGCGSIVEGRNVVLQGDMTTRAAVWLRTQGAKQIVIGN